MQKMFFEIELVEHLTRPHCKGGLLALQAE
jgi:hypothetical protein